MPLDLALRYFRSPEIPRTRKLLVVGGVLAYIFFPVDAVPDVIPWLGWLDDAGVVGLALAYMGRELRRLEGPVGAGSSLAEVMATSLAAPLPGGVEVISARDELRR